MSALGTALLAQIEVATGAGDFAAVRQALTRCATAVTAGEFEAGEAGLIRVAARSANKTMLGAGRRAEWIAKAVKTAEIKRCADQTRVTLAFDRFKTLDDRDWTTQLLAAGNAQKGHARKGR